MGDEVVSAEIRLALEELGKVVGAVYTEDLLDRIFSRFCIGK
jgi:tRNA modification GTPase